MRREDKKVVSLLIAAWRPICIRWEGESGCAKSSVRMLLSESSDILSGAQETEGFTQQTSSPTPHAPVSVLSGWPSRILFCETWRSSSISTSRTFLRDIEFGPWKGDRCQATQKKPSRLIFREHTGPCTLLIVLVLSICFTNKLYVTYLNSKLKVICFNIRAHLFHNIYHETCSMQSEIISNCFTPVYTVTSPFCYLDVPLWCLKFFFYILID